MPEVTIHGGKRKNRKSLWWAHHEGHTAFLHLDPETGKYTARMLDAGLNSLIKQSAPRSLATGKDWIRRALTGAAR